MENYIKEKTLDIKIEVKYSTIATTYDFSYDKALKYEYIFCLKTMEPYSKEPIAVLLSAILYLMKNLNLTNSTTVRAVNRIILYSENKSTEDKQNQYCLAITKIHELPNKLLIQKLCHHVIFERVNPALVAEAKAYIAELLEQGRKYDLL